MAMDDERIKLAQIELRRSGRRRSRSAWSCPAPSFPMPAGSPMSRSSSRARSRSCAKTSETTSLKDEVIAVLESREVADAKSEYLAARLSNELQQDLTARDKSLWEGRAVPEQQYIKSRNAAAQTAMRFGIARQKLMALGVVDDEIAALPQAPDASLRSQNVRAPISGRVAERKVELGTAVGRDNLETELFVIVDLSRVWVELSVSSR